MAGVTEELTKGLSPRGRGNLYWDRQGQALPRSFVPPRIKVYPRVGGGTRMPTDAHRPKSGLSPRGRGNQPAKNPKEKPMRSIPAWSGEPAARSELEADLGVYPRVVGGTPYG